MLFIGRKGSSHKFSAFNQYFSSICFLEIYSRCLTLEGSSLLLLQLRRLAGRGCVVAAVLLWTGDVELSRAATAWGSSSCGATLVSVTAILASSSLSHNTSHAHCLYITALKIKPCHAACVCPSHPAAQTHSITFNTEYIPRHCFHSPASYILPQIPYTFTVISQP